MRILSNSSNYLRSMILLAYLINSFSADENIKAPIFLKFFFFFVGDLSDDLEFYIFYNFSYNNYDFFLDNKLIFS